jgi:hypothetical protein
MNPRCSIREERRWKELLPDPVILITVVSYPQKPGGIGDFPAGLEDLGVIRVRGSYEALENTSNAIIIYL